ncbi:MAG TPA: hypothetical protein VGF69_23120 [Thermoanaerobaculia bacterium]
MDHEWMDEDFIQDLDEIVRKVESKDLTGWETIVFVIGEAED